MKPSASCTIPVFFASANSNVLTTFDPFNVTPPSSTFELSNHHQHLVYARHDTETKVGFRTLTQKHENMSPQPQETIIGHRVPKNCKILGTSFRLQRIMLLRETRIGTTILT